MKIDSLTDTTSKLIQLETLNVSKADSVKIITRLSDRPTETLIMGIPEGFARILIPIAVTVLIFFLGHFISWLKGKYERKKEVSSYKNLISKWIELISKSIEAQITSCDQFAENLEKSEDMSPTRFSANKLLAEKINSLPLEKLINAFSVNTTGDKDKNYKMTFNLVSQFNYLTNVELSIAENFEAYSKLFDELVKRWNLLFTEFDDIISGQSKEIGKNKEHPNFRFHEEVLKIVNEWIRTSPSDKNSILHTNNKLIKPLIELTAKELNSNQNDYAFKLSRVIRDLNIELIQWDNAKRVNADLFRNTAETIKHAYDKLLEANVYFKIETKTVNILRIK